MYKHVFIKHLPPSSCCLLFRLNGSAALVTMLIYVEAVTKMITYLVKYYVTGPAQRDIIDHTHYIRAVGT